MRHHIIAGYKFVQLDMLPLLQADLMADLQRAGVLGTVLLAEEGINLMLSGSSPGIDQARQRLRQVPELTDLTFKESHSERPPFGKLKVKIRREIIAFDGGEIRPDQAPAPELAPQTLKSWLDQGREFTLLDTRNQYEIDSGTFASAQALPIDTFREFREAVLASELDKSRPVVAFCTGGIRCEKAAPWLLQQGFTEVYQLDGGILNYFDACGGEHWEGACFVFDDRVEVDTNLTETGATMCTNCHRAVTLSMQASQDYVAGESCPACRPGPSG